LAQQLRWWSGAYTVFALLAALAVARSRAQPALQPDAE